MKSHSVRFRKKNGYEGEGDLTSEANFKEKENKSEEKTDVQ